MSSAAILSIKPVYGNQILAGTKTIELRKSAMGLCPGDVVLVYSSAPEQCLRFWFRIDEVEVLPVAEMWLRYAEHLGIGREDYDAYFSGLDNATGLHVGQVHPLQPLDLQTIRAAVPGFAPPQGLVWLREAVGRYAKMLAALSDPLPADVFPQLTLDLLDPTAPARRTA